ncbi:N-terminal domain of NEFA-interacting nuclear protein NIP30-domain-containing protein [Xylaria arbuscula]|nr:N-terminal domain of NEFA-interacting nuclear protein NIP30-domain-containing protein [Xylaria arbuscula]
MSSRFVSGGVIAGHDDGNKTSSQNANHSDPNPKGDDGRTTTTSTSTPTTTAPTTGTGDAGRSGGGGSATGTGIGSMSTSSQSQEWAAVQKEIEEDRRRRAEARKRDVEGGGEKSLYEILQANKAAKQAAFEEQNRIRNQFRALDDDEIEFLHGVSDEKRAEEEQLRRETEAGLASFRKAQQKATGGGSGGSGGDENTIDVRPGTRAGAGADDDVVGTEEWVGGRKRKRDKDKDKDNRAGFKGLRRRTSSSLPEEDKKVDGITNGRVSSLSSDGRHQASASAKGAATTPINTNTNIINTATTTTTLTTLTATTAPQSAAVKSPPIAKPKPKPSLGLVDYGSGEDADD